MYGHDHEDYFTLLKGRNGEYMNVAYVCPSLSTYVGNHPAFQVFEMDRDTYKLLDYVQYWMNLTESNEKNTSLWNESYRFTKYYNKDSLSLRSHQLLLEEMKVVFYIIIEE